MGRRLLLAGLVAVAALLFTLTLLDSESSPEAPAADRSPTAPERELAPEPTDVTRRPEPQATATGDLVEPRLPVFTPAAPEAPARTLEGRVVDGRGLAIADVQVTPCTPEGEPLLDLPSAATDDDGRFTLVRAPHARFESELYLDRIVSVPDEVGAGWEVVLRARPIVEGLVRDHTGATVLPPGEVQVSVIALGATEPRRFSADLGQDGGFRVRGLPVGRLVHLSARAKGFDAFGEDLELTLEPDGVYAHDVTLEPGLVVHGVVLDETTLEPVPFAKVWGEGFDYEADSVEPSTIADAEGRFRIEGFKREPHTFDGTTFNTFRIVAASETHASSPLTAYALRPDENGEYEVELLLFRRSCSVSGIVLEPDGTTPAVGALVWAIDGENNYTLRTADRDGAFEFEGLPAGSFGLVAYRTERGDDGLHAARTLEVELVDGTAEVLTVVLAAELATELTGVVRDSAGAPLAGHEVRASYQFNFGGLTIGLDQESALTGGDGRYVFRGMRPGLHVLEPAGCARPREYELMLRLGERREVDFVAGSCMTVEGWVLLDGAAPESFEVGLFEVSGRQMIHSARPDAEGVFAIPNVLSGDYELRLFRDGTPAGSAPVTAAAPTGIVLGGS